VVRADCMEAVSACREQESLVHLLIAAAGSGRRMGADCNKRLLPLLGRPVLAWTLEAAFAASDIRWIGVIGQPLDQAAIAHQDGCRPARARPDNATSQPAPHPGQSRRLGLRG